MLLSRMVENVIENAISHNEPGGWVRVTPTDEGPLASLVVENGGRLLAQDDVDQFAEPFRRLGTPRTGSQTGSGLGLSIVASIAQAHGGALDLHARADGGLRVVIELPAAAGGEAGARRMRILVVEDNRPLAEVVAEGLRDAGMAVDVAYDGLDAAAKLGPLPLRRRRARPRPPRSARRHSVHERSPTRDQATMVLMLTAADAPGRTGRRAGARCRRLLGEAVSFPRTDPPYPRARPPQAGRAGNRVHNVAGIELNTVTHTASRDGRPLDLSSKEFAVLEALITASPGVLSAEQLLQRAWDENADPFTHTVKVTIGRLRRKLGEPPVVHTISGVGYRV